MSNSVSQQSLGDFAAILVREVAQALLLARENAPFVEVREIRLRLGKLPSSGDQEADASDFILSERYPRLERGWELELELGNQVQATLGGKSLSLPSGAGSALDLFGQQPVTVIKGISAQWCTRLAEVKITTVTQLAEMSDQQLHQLISDRHSLRPREFRGKARLLATPVPWFPVKSIQGQTLSELLALPAKELHRLLGEKKISTTELQRFNALLDALSIAIDREILDKIELRELLEN